MKDRQEICSHLFRQQDSETMGHSIRVANGCVKLAKELVTRGFSVSDDFLVYEMHDIGKLMIVHEVLWQSQPLSRQQYSLIKQHTIEGFLLLTNSLREVDDKLCATTAEVALLHHENFDGSGYPLKIYGAKIPLEARICRIVDSYDAMISKRCYKNSQPQKEVIKELNKCTGSFYDPIVMPVFEELILECRGNFLL